MDCQSIESYELLEQKNYVVYFNSSVENKSSTYSLALENYGFDDENGYYIININDHISFRYKILSIIGKGAFGNAILAEDKKYGYQSVLKIIRNELRFHRSAEKEVEILSKLKHPNIIYLEKHFSFRNHKILVFEYCGIDLYKKYIKKRILVSNPNLKDKVLQILNGLNYLQSKNIIHCDLKPENILENDSNHIKIIDLGSSCYIPNIPKNYYIQSRWYRSPEVILGSIKYTNYIDIWSLGCIIYELSTNYSLFPGKNESDLIYLFTKIIGCPTKNINYYKKFSKYFKENNILLGGKDKFDLLYCPSKNYNNIINKFSIFKYSNPALYSLILDCLTWDYKNRSPISEIIENTKLLV